MPNRRYNKNSCNPDTPRPEENKTKHYRVFKPTSIETNYDSQGPLLPKEPVIFPVPQLQLPGPLTAFQPQPGCGDQQQLPGFCPDPVGLQPIPVNQAPVYPYAQQQYNPYTTEGTVQQFQQDGFIQQPASGQVACTASNGQLFYQGTNNQDIYSINDGLGFQGMGAGSDNVAGGFAGGWVNNLDPKGFLNYDQQSLLTPTWSTQDMTGDTPGPPGISPGGFQQPIQYPNTLTNNTLSLQQPTGGGAAVTPTANLVFNFPSVASTNSLGLNAISQDNRSPMFDPSVPPPQPMMNFNIQQQQDFNYQAQFQGWNRTLISLPDVNSTSSFTTGSFTGLHQYHSLQPIDPAGYSGAQPQPGPYYGTNPTMVGQPYPVVGQGVQIPVSGGQYFVPAQWPNGNEEYNYNLQNYPAQYYGVSANMPLLSQRSDGADSGVVSDFASLTLGDTDESSTSSRKQDEASSKDTSGASTDREKQDSDDSNQQEKKDSRVVSSTPDIVKSVEENKAEEADKSENNNDVKQTKGEPETNDNSNKAVTEDNPGLKNQAPNKPVLPLPSPNPVQGFVEQQQGMTYFTYNPYNEQQYTTTGDCAYPGATGAVQTLVPHPGGGLVQPQQPYPYTQVQNEYSYLNNAGGQVYDQYTMQPQLVTSVPSGQFQQLPGGGQYPAAIPTPVQQEDYNSYASQSGGFYVPAASYPQVYYK